MELGWLLCPPCRFALSDLWRFVHGVVADLWCYWFAHDGAGLRLAAMEFDGGWCVRKLRRGEWFPWLKWCRNAAVVCVNGGRRGGALRCGWWWDVSNKRRCVKDVHPWLTMTEQWSSRGVVQRRWWRSSCCHGGRECWLLGFEGRR